MKNIFIIIIIGLCIIPITSPILALVVGIVARSFAYIAILVGIILLVAVVIRIFKERSGYGER